MRDSFLGYALGGVALLTGCSGNNILLTTAHAGASSGGGASVGQPDLGGSGGSTDNGGRGDHQVPPESGGGGAVGDGKGGTGPIVDTVSEGGAAGAPELDGQGLLGQWRPLSDYPSAGAQCFGTGADLYCDEPTCVASSDRVVCVGAGTDLTYSAAVSSAGFGPWTATTNYPVPTYDQMCVTDANVMYCIGGRVWNDQGVLLTANTYFAPLSAAGVGDWTATTPFPTTNQILGCVTSGGYVYCRTYDNDNSFYYAPLSASGIGTWQRTQGTPTHTDGCVADGGYIYCFGGGNCPPADPNSDCYSPSYYAPINEAGIGTWKTTSPVPTAGWAKFVSDGSSLFFLSVPVFGARLSSSGIGPWETTTNYPHNQSASDCFSSADYVYCVKAEPGSSYFAQLGVANPSALHLVNPPAGSRSKYLQPAFIHGGGGAVIVDGVMAGAPSFGKNIDDAILFDCAAEAATPAGCQQTVVSPEDTTYNYDLTIWYPCPSGANATTNCCFQTKVGYENSPFYAWCASTDTGSFIVTQPMTLR